jgi:uncharacterized repeat protein (TIGR02543 family)
VPQYPNNITWDTWSYEKDHDSREWFEGSRYFKDADGNDIALPDGYSYTDRFVYTDYHDGYVWVRDKRDAGNPKLGILKLAGGQPVSGAVSIIGSASVGSVLAADFTKAVPSDPSGYDVTWQWKPSPDSAWANVTEDTAGGLTLTSKYSNKSVRFVARTAAGSEYTGALTSAEVRVEKQSISGKPEITGSAEIGGVLTAAVASIQPDAAQAGDFLYQWKREGADIGGATNPSYVLTFADSNKNISVEMTAAVNSDFTGSLESDPARVAPAAITGAVAISADAAPITEGTLLTAVTTGVTPPEAQAELTYQWNGVSGGTADGITYTITAEDVSSSQPITVTVSASADYSGSLTSAPVEASKTALSGTVSLTNDEGALTYIIAPALDDVELNKQWTRNGADISGATGETYQTTPADAGKTIGLVLTPLSGTHTGSLAAPGIAIPALSPGAPADLTVEAGTGNIMLAWEPPEFDGGAPIGGYYVRIDEETPIVLSALASEYTFTGIAANTSHTVGVAAFNSAGAGNYASDEVAAGAVLYTITFNANGGAVSPASALTGDLGKLAGLPTPAFSGYRFDGWYTAATGGSQITLDTVFNADATVYAHWTYTGGGSGGGGGGGGSALSGSVPAVGGAASVEYVQTGEFITLSLPDGKVSEIIRKSGDTASIDLSKLSGATAAVLPEAAFGKFADAGKGVEIVLPQGAVTLAPEATASVATQASGANVIINFKTVIASSLSAAQRAAIKPGDVIFDISILSGGQNITRFDGRITVSAPYGETLPAGAWYLTDAGAREKTESSYSAANKTLSFVLPHLSFYIVGFDEESQGASMWSNPFTDVKEGDWFYGDVEYAIANGLLNGTETNTFSPQTPMTRGMLVTVIGRLHGADASGYTANSFDDVAAAQYYAPYIEWAKQNGIVSGVGGNTFAPDAPVARQDLAAIISRYAEFAGKQIPAALQYLAFADEADIAGYAKAATQTLYRGGMIVGKPDNFFDPKGSTTRAEVAALLHRFTKAAE